MKIRFAKPVQVLAVLGVLVFAPQSWSAVACNGAQLQQAKTDPSMKAYCQAQDALIKTENSAHQEDCDKDDKDNKHKQCPPRKSPH